MATPVAPSQPVYPTTCPRCSSQLQPVALDGQSAPWLCGQCRLGFFATELSADARRLYRPRHSDFGFGAPAIALRAAVDQEQAAARTRGTSLREDQLSLVPAASLKALKVTNQAFAALVAQAITARGA